MIETNTNRRIKVLIADDSAFARWVVSNRLRSDPGIEIAGFAGNGIEAIEKIAILRPDVVTMDVQMPRMDGLTALRHIMSECPTPVVMVSSITGEDAGPTIEALDLGAADFFQKPSATSPAGSGSESAELVSKVKQSARIRIPSLMSATGRRPTGHHAISISPAHPGSADTVVVIGSSIGGPRALCRLIPSLPSDIPAAVLIVQHMPAGFTRSLAERLNQASQIEVREAAEGDVLHIGQALVAPGGYHTVVKRAGGISLNREAPVCGVRPSVDVTMESAARIYGSACVAVVLTGMGTDGTAGTARIKSFGGRVIAEDESTCTVFGMPKSVIESGNADMVLPLPEMVDGIMESLAIVSRSRIPVA